jgi:hypothetical protein
MSEAHEQQLPSHACACACLAQVTLLVSYTRTQQLQPLLHDPLLSVPALCAWLSGQMDRAALLDKHERHVGASIISIIAGLDLRSTARQQETPRCDDDLSGEAGSLERARVSMVLASLLAERSCMKGGV